jgi:hypothetical protein
MLTLFLMLLPALAGAQVVSPVRSVQDVIDKVLCPVATLLYSVALVVGIMMAIVAAYKYLFSGGNPEAVRSAHKALTYAAIGIAVAIIASGVPIIVAGLLGLGMAKPC